MKRIDLIEKVGEHAIINNVFYYVKEQSIFSYENKSLIKLHDYWGVQFNNNVINVFTNRSYNKFYSYSGKILNEYPNINFYHIISENDFIYFDRLGCIGLNR